jgi:hypothetical protein
MGDILEISIVAIVWSCITAMISACGAFVITLFSMYFIKASYTLTELWYATGIIGGGFGFPMGG